MLPKKGECTEYILLRGDLLSNLAPWFNGFLESQLTGKDVRNVSNNKYIQLCYDERIVIENRLKNGESYTAIAKSLGRSTSTISREVNSFIEEQIKRLPGRKRDKNRRRVNVPAITSLDGRKYRGQVMVSTIRKAKEGVKRRQRLHNKLYSY